MVTWVLSKAVALLAFFTTLVYVRAIAGLARRLLPKSFVVRHGMAVIAFFYIAPTAVIALTFLLARAVLGAVWFSPTALWLSLIWDFLVALGAFSYYVTLWRLRRSPESFSLAVKLSKFEDWPSLYTLEAISRHTVILIGWMILERWFGEKFPVTPSDFHRILRADFRLVDAINEGEMVEAELAKSQAIPHLLGDERENSDEGEYDPAQRLFGRLIKKGVKAMANLKPDTPETKELLEASRELLEFEEDVPSSGQAPLINRALNAPLPDELWDVSCNLCGRTPEVITASWRRFHAQDGLRLRLVSLFTTAELLQRLAGAMVIARLRDTERLRRTVAESDPLKPPASNGQWTWTLRWALKEAGDGDPALNWMREFLLAPRDDFHELIRTLEPFEKIVSRATLHSAGSRDTLAGWEILWMLRNKIVGHGGVGWQLQARPLVYLGALHRFFLGLIGDLVSYDLKVSAVVATPEHETKVVGRKQEIRLVQMLGDNCLAVSHLPGSNTSVLLNPYFRFHSGRLLMFNRLRAGNAEYVDYLTDNIDEPTFKSFPETDDSFLSRSSVSAALNQL